MSMFILPGMGADSQMYSDSAYHKCTGVVYSNWPKHKGEQSIPEIAERIIKEHNITENQIVGGSSLGGIVAAEIAKQIKIQKIILIGSTLTPKSINPALEKLSKMAVLAPIDLIQILAGKVTLSQENSLFRMFSKSESAFIRAMSTAVFKWEGNPSPNCEVFSIHGAKDKVISPPTNCSHIINDGGHLIAMTHPRIIAEFINKSKSPEQFH